MIAQDYKEFQIGKVLFAMALPAQLFIAYFFIEEMGVDPRHITGFLVLNSLFVLVYLMFYGMTTIISDDRITISFGIGLIRKNIHIDKISSIHSVDNPGGSGFGIRMNTQGMLYNIDGKHAVELRLKNTSRIIRIGTSNSTQLKRKIARRMKV